MTHFELTPDEFTDLAEYRQPGFFSTQAGFIALRPMGSSQALDAEWDYVTTPSMSYRGFALVVTLT